MYSFLLRLEQLSTYFHLLDAGSCNNESRRLFLTMLLMPRWFKHFLSSTLVCPLSSIDPLVFPSHDYLLPGLPIFLPHQIMLLCLNFHLQYDVYAWSHTGLFSSHVLVSALCISSDLASFQWSRFIESLHGLTVSIYGSLQALP